MKLVYIMGMPSSGTKAAAGTLMANGYWISNPRTSSLECKEGYSVLDSRYGNKTHDALPDRKPDMKMVKAIFDDYKARAADEDAKKCFMKANWMPLWCPEIFESVSPLLIWRDPEECAMSLMNRDDLKKLAKDRKRSEIVAHCVMGMARIEWLSKKYGWPIWRFGKEAKVSDLEKAVGEPLPEPFFDPEIIRTKC